MLTGISEKLTASIVWAMEAVSFSETLVSIYQTTRYYNTEDSRLHTPRRENLKSRQGNNAYK
jgi:hypothetical protein